jgi:hypothetical protein
MASGAGRRLSILTLLAAMAAVLPRPSHGQLRPDEIASRAEWEAFLASAEIVGRRQITGPGAVTEPWVLTLRSGPVERQALWKDVDGKPKGILDCWRYEIAAYRLDKALGLGMIPATVERRDGARKGSCQLYSPDAEPLRDRLKTLEELTPAGLAVWRRGGYIQQAFDNLIGNSDRSQGNILLTPDWRWVLIDHSRAFRTEAAYTKELPFTEKRFPKTEMMKELPRAFVEKLRALDEAAIATAVGPYLEKKEIRAVLARKALLLAWIDAEIGRVGEGKFLY